MPKLLRCESGHVFDSEAHSACPDCARLGIVHESADGMSSAASADAAAERHESRPLFVAGALAIPVSWLVGGGAAAAIALTVGIIVLFPSPTPQPPPQSEPAPRNEIAELPKPDIPPADVKPLVPSPEPQPAPEFKPLILPPLPDPLPQLPPIAPKPAPQAPPVPMFDPSKITLDKVGAIRNGWGALAFNPKTRSWGESWGFNNPAQARRRALIECGGEEQGCEAAVWYHRKCGAIAADRSGRWASGLGDTIAAAARDAYIDCARGGGAACELLRVNCTR